MKRIAFGVAVLSVVACTKKGDSLSDVMASSSFQEGEFKLYPERNAKPNPDCDVHTSLSLRKGPHGSEAFLVNRLGGFCEIAVFPNERMYKIESTTSDSCGAKISKGTRLRAQGGLDRIEIIDNRLNVCEIVLPAPVVVTETINDKKMAPLFSLNQAPKASKKFICENVNGTEEWNLMIDLEKNRAGFFDNDNTAVVPLLRTLSLESNPPQTLHIFEGPDSGGSQDDVLRISFNETKLEGSVTLSVGKPGEKTHKALAGCRADDSFELDE